MFDPDVLRPGIENPSLWHADKPKGAEWSRTRLAVLERDDYRCMYCGHRATKNMHVHHRLGNASNEVKDLATVCVACHAVLHIGRNLDLGTIEIWQVPGHLGFPTEISQVGIVQKTRDLVKEGRSLGEIKDGFVREYQLKPGAFPPDSIDWANLMVTVIDMAAKEFSKPKSRFTDFAYGPVECYRGDSEALVPRASLNELHIALFVNFKQWQI